MPEQKSDNYFVVMSGERPSTYLVKGTLDEVKKACQHRMWNMTIFALQASPSQTSNPWGGTRLNEVAHNYPTVDIDNDVNSLNFALDTFTLDQHKALVEKIYKTLREYVDRRSGALLELLADPQTEIIDMPKAEPSNPSLPEHSEPETLDDMPNVPSAVDHGVTQQERVDVGGDSPVLPVQSSVEPEHSATPIEPVDVGGTEGKT